MFGEFERTAQYTTIAADFMYDDWVIHRFMSVVPGVTHVRVHFGNADIAGDSAASFDMMTVDLAGSYATNQGTAIVPPPVMDGWCMVPGDTGPMDYMSLSGQLFEYTGAVQTYTVPAGHSSGSAVDQSGNTVMYVNVWIAGAGGGLGSREHPRDIGGAGGFAFGSLGANFYWFSLFYDCVATVL